jgi:Mannosyl-glycoprotein endo-beta-N-acetylglucosaminidase
MLLNQALANHLLNFFKRVQNPMWLQSAWFLIISLACLPCMANGVKNTHPPSGAAQTKARGAIDQRLVDDVFTKICEKNIEFPSIVMRQAILETGWFRSQFLMSKNNLFGFKHRQYLQFDHFEESIDFYKQWQDRHLPSDTMNYYQFLEKIKYGTPGYTKHLQHIAWNKACNEDTVTEQ